MQSRMKWKTEGTVNPLFANEMLREAALDMFSARRFHDASLNDIIKTAASNKGSFYYRFYDKMDLYLSVLSIVVNEKMEIISEYDLTGVTGGFFNILRTISEISLRFGRQYPRQYEMWKRVTAEEEPVLLAVEAEFGKVTGSEYAGLIAAAVARSQIRGDLSIRLVSTVVNAAFDALDGLLRPESSEEEIDTVLTQTVSLLKDGLKLQRSVFS